MNDKKTETDRLIEGWAPGEKAMTPAKSNAPRPTGPPPKPSDMKRPPRRDGR